MIKAPCTLIWNLKHHHEHNCQRHYQHFLIISVKFVKNFLSYFAKQREREKHQPSHDLHSRGNKCQPRAFFSASHAFSLKFAQLKV